MLMSYFLVWRTPETSRKICEDLLFFFWRTPKILRKICGFLGEKLIFFGEHLRVVSLFFVLEHSCHWPREGLSLGVEFF